MNTRLNLNVIYVTCFLARFSSQGSVSKGEFKQYVTSRAIKVPSLLFFIAEQITQIFSQLSEISQSSDHVEYATVYQFHNKFSNIFLITALLNHTTIF